MNDSLVGAALCLIAVGIGMGIGYTVEAAVKWVFGA
jgi:hypothetical protein